MKKLFLQLSVIVLLAVPALVSAESPAFQCSKKESISKEKAAELLKAVQDAYSGIKSFQAGFYQDSYLASLDASETSTGTMWFEKPGRMKWLYKEPDEQTFVVKENTLWFYQKKENQVLIDTFDKVALSDLPVSFLMGLGNLNKDFKIKSACKNGEGVVFSLLPQSSRQKQNDQKSELEGFSLLVDEASHFPRGARVSDVGGNRTTILFRESKVNAEAPPQAFTFDIPKGVDVNDRRENSGKGQS